MTDTDIANAIKELIPAVKAGDKNATTKVVDLLAMSFAEVAQKYLDVVKHGVHTTRNDYGTYMAFLGQYKGLYRLAIAKSLIDNGHNKQGVDDAMALLSGRDSLSMF